MLHSAGCRHSQVGQWQHKSGRLAPKVHIPASSALPAASVRVGQRCSSTSHSSSTSSSSTSTGIRAPLLPASAASRQPGRISVITHSWFGQQPTQRLWDYSGSNVKQLLLRELELLHRLSFGHRNQRSYLVVLYKPDSPACQAFEAEVERLASGLRHEPAFVTAALDVSSSEAIQFVSSMLNVDSVPSVLLYPEAARGCLRFLGPDMSAGGMLAAINKARKAALPGTATSPGAAEWQLIEAATPLSVTALRAAAASGDREAVVAALQQQMQPIQPTPLAPQQASSYWTQGRGQLWGGLLLCSLLFLAWDLKLSDLWEDWCLTRRQAARQQGRRFTPQENLDDIVTYMMKSISGQAQLQQQLMSAEERQQLVAMAQQQQQQQQEEWEQQLVGSPQQEANTQLTQQQTQGAGHQGEQVQEAEYASQAGMEQQQQQQQQQQSDGVLLSKQNSQPSQ